MQELGKSDELQYLYLTTIGRTTGQPREIEIWFVEYEGRFYILAEHYHKAQWVKNISRNANVRVRIDTERFNATARVLSRDNDEALWLTAQQLAREKYGWGDGLPVEITRVE